MRFSSDFADILTENAPLAPMTTFRIGGPARYLFAPRSRGELAGVFRALAEAGVPWRILGGGSNVLIPDEGFPGAVVRMAGDLERMSFDGARVEAGAAARLGRLVGECPARGLSGAEGLVGIPGTVGGALIMNAGGRWGRIGDLVETVSVLGSDGHVRTLDTGGVRFGYRESSLRGSVVLGASLRLAVSGQAAVERTTREYLHARKSTQDMGARSAGCIFRNPPSGPSAGALIDAAGLKGARAGGAEVSSVHANFIINAADATAEDVKALINLVRDGVRRRSGVALSLEVELW